MPCLFYFFRWLNSKKSSFHLPFQFFISHWSCCRPLPPWNPQDCPAFTSSLAFLTSSLLQTPSTQFFITNHVLEEQWWLLSSQSAQSFWVYILSHLVPWFQLLHKCWVWMSTWSKDLSSEVWVQTSALYCISSHTCLTGVSNTWPKWISCLFKSCCFTTCLYYDVRRDIPSTGAD